MFTHICRINIAVTGEKHVFGWFCQLQGRGGGWRSSAGLGLYGWTGRGMIPAWGMEGAAGAAAGSGSRWWVQPGALSLFGKQRHRVGVRGRREGMVRSSRALGVSWAMGLARGVQMGAWDGPLG